jgi:hypothetical protein
MKSQILIIFYLLISIAIFAQSPQAFKYQAVVRDNAGNVVVNKLISIKSSILIDSLNGNSVYSETHSLATNDFGIVNLSIGKGTVLIGNFNTISWGGHNYFIKTEVDFNGGSNYQYLGTSQLLSVPYALYAEKSGTSGADNDNQTLSINGNNLSISNGNTVAIPADNDSDPKNELQALSISNDTLYLSNGNKVFLGIFKDNTDNQQLVLNGNQLQISGGNSITLSGAVDLDSDPTNELQILTKSSDTIYLTNGNFIVLDKDLDADSLNELQLLNKRNDTLYLSKGNFVVFDKDQDPDSLNEIQYLNIKGDTLFLTKSNYVLLPPDLDNDPTNELQTLTITQDSIKLSGGGSFAFPQPTNAVLPSGGCFYSENPNPPNGYSYSGEFTVSGKHEWENIWDTTLSYSTSANTYTTRINDKLYTIYYLSSTKHFIEIDLITKQKRILNNGFRLRGSSLTNTEHLNSVGDKIYFMGGTTGALTYIDVYDIPTNTWSILSNNIYGVSGSISFVYNNKIYFIGSQLNTSNTPYNKIFIYDPNNSSWEIINNNTSAVFATISDYIISNDTLYFGRTSLYYMALNSINEIKLVGTLTYTLSGNNSCLLKIDNSIYQFHFSSTTLTVNLINSNKIMLINSLNIATAITPNYITYKNGLIYFGDVVNEIHRSYNFIESEFKDIPKRILPITSNSIIYTYEAEDGFYLYTYNNPRIMKLKTPKPKYMHCAN